MKYKIHGKIPKEKFEEYKAQIKADKSNEQELLETMFNVDLSIKKKTKTIMGVEFTEEELAKMERPIEESEPFIERQFDREQIEDQYLAESLGLEIDENGELKVPKDKPKKRGIFF